LADQRSRRSQPIGKDCQKGLHILAGIVDYRIAFGMAKQLGAVRETAAAAKTINLSVRGAAFFSSPVRVNWLKLTT
jgi:hypothetical protein